MGRYLWGDTYLQNPTDSIIVIAMIETDDWVANMTNIAQVEGVGGLFAGPNAVAHLIGGKLVFDSENTSARAA